MPRRAGPSGVLQRSCRGMSATPVWSVVTRVRWCARGSVQARGRGRCRRASGNTTVQRELEPRRPLRRHHCGTADTRSAPRDFAEDQRVLRDGQRCSSRGPRYVDVHGEFMPACSESWLRVWLRWWEPRSSCQACLGCRLDSSSPTTDPCAKQAGWNSHHSAQPCEYEGEEAGEDAPVIPQDAATRRCNRVLRL